MGRIACRDTRRGKRLEQILEKLAPIVLAPIANMTAEHAGISGAIFPRQLIAKIRIIRHRPVQHGEQAP
ncbi:hypothetical protein ASE30_07520 [Achromobacter sp. Root83]|nr:hypothetical protein ASE30_07520 [Achromobacter sp. Root83]